MGGTLTLTGSSCSGSSELLHSLGSWGQTYLTAILGVAVVDGCVRQNTPLHAARNSPRHGGDWPMKMSWVLSCLLWQCVSGHIPSPVFIKAEETSTPRRFTGGMLKNSGVTLVKYPQSDQEYWLHLHYHVTEFCFITSFSCIRWPSAG